MKSKTSPDMRHIVYSSLALAALCLAIACQHETLPDASKNGLRKMTVHASQADTRTYVKYNSTEDKWLSFWSGGDEIDLFGFSSDDDFISGSSSQSLVEEGDRNATFSVTFYSDAPLSGDWRYFGAYPSRNAEPISSDDPRWIGAWGRSSTRRWGLIGTIPSYQRVAQYGFDREADLMVSKMTGDVELTTEDFDLVGDVSLAFARVGSIMKLNLTGIPSDVSVITGTLTHGNSWQSTGEIMYDPQEKKMVVLPPDSDDGGTTIEISDCELTEEDGQVVVWFRVLSGTLSDYFSIEVTTVDYSSDEFSEKTYRRTVNLNGREIKFTEGNITALTVRVYEDE